MLILGGQYQEGVSTNVIANTGESQKVLLPHCIAVFLESLPPPHIVSKTAAALLFEENVAICSPSASQNFEANSPN